MVFLINLQIANAAFSTPYLPNNTVILNGTTTYTFNMVFQNPGESDTAMDFEVVNGSEWITPNKFSIEVKAKQFDKATSFQITVPSTIKTKVKNQEGVEEEKDVPFVLEYNKPYTIIYTVSSGDGGSGGMVPVSSAVKKKFYVVVYKNESQGFSIPIKYLIVLLVIIISLIGYWYWNKKEKEKEQEQILAHQHQYQQYQHNQDQGGNQNG